ncbi:3-oxoacyl-ACP reductase family protein [Mycobacterium sp. NPDC006124]|uniref:3-oxoacyl-ACP reductase family protein n=1 Tax=Mycobacterium sp. NPDC006124 TaxID=3156729 RepID=UPI0033B64D21
MSTTTSDTTTGSGPLSGRRALVTGGSRGIGAAIVQRLAADGADVVFTYNASADVAENVAAQASASGATVHAVKADSADAEAVRDAVQEAVDRLGGLDILVNNAGVASGAPIEAFPLEEFDRLVAVNVRGVFAAIQAAVPHLSSGGRVITIGSVNESRVPVPGLAVYAMTKAAVSGLTRGLARELGPRGITVNNVAVGPTDTDMNPDDDGDMATGARAMMPLQRYGQPEEIASAVAYLALPEAGYVTGSSWYVDGGYAV